MTAIRTESFDAVPDAAIPTVTPGTTNLSVITSGVNAVVGDRTTKYAGLGSVRCTWVGGDATMTLQWRSLGNLAYARVRGVYMIDTAGTFVHMHRFNDAGGVLVAAGYISTGAKLQIKDATSVAVATGTTTIPMDTWVGLELVATTAGLIEQRLWLDPSTMGGAADETITFTQSPVAAIDRATLMFQAETTPAQRVWIDSGELHNAAGISAQTLGPATDITTAGWTVTGGTGTAASTLDESPASDTDYVSSPYIPTDSVFEVKFPAAVDPVTSTGHVFSYRLRARNSSTYTVIAALYQGSTLISEETRTTGLTTSFQTFNKTLTGAEADSITNYSDLRLRLTVTADT